MNQQYKSQHVILRNTANTYDDYLIITLSNVCG